MTSRSYFCLLLFQTASLRQLLVGPTKRTMATNQFNHPVSIAITEDEASIQSMINKMCQDIVAPRTQRMDEVAKLDKEVIDALFKNGVSVVLLN